MLTSDQLIELAARATQARSSEDSQAAAKLLAILVQAPEPDYAEFTLSDVENVMQIAALLAELGDIQTITSLYARCCNTIQDLDVGPENLILPLYNLRASHLKMGATEDANKLLGRIVEVARSSGMVPLPAMKALVELVPLFEDAGYLNEAVILYRPVCLTLVADTQVDWQAKLKSAMRLAGLFLSDGRPGDAVTTYEWFQAQMEVSSAVPAAEFDNKCITLWNLIAQARIQAADTQAAERAYLAARDLADTGKSTNSFEAAVTYRNLAAFWLDRGVTERYAQAAILTQRSLDIARRLGHDTSVEYANGLGQLARLKVALGDNKQAERSFADCFAVFAEADHVDPAVIANLRYDQATLFLGSGHAGKAAASFQAAGDERAGIAGFPVEELADANAWTGVAHFENEDFDAASQAFRSALTLRLKSA